MRRTRRTLVALTTAAALSLSSTPAFAAESSKTDLGQEVAGSSYYNALHEAVATTDNEDLNRFLIVLVGGLIGFAAFAVIGSLYGEVAKLLPH
ncbi:hypothetical protein [Corynebacterium sp.]|uniref:hypothetical protein n=1 Tax=Corynebacterium sp. TaxID=1720 RepID=UPI0026DD0FBD|nr:hypothetical protein [Corynebacterium sp.]MDO5031786.1 hypothetical protein [Corynebacterium sp.]